MRKPRAKKIDEFLPMELVVSVSTLSIQLPIKTVSEANRFEHWQKRAARQKIYLDLIRLSLAPHASRLVLPCTVTVKRYGPKLMDEHDNLRMAFKKIIDVLAEILTGKKRGQGDNDPRITWKYDQEKSSAYGVKIIFEF